MAVASSLVTSGKRVETDVFRPGQRHPWFGRVRDALAFEAHHQLFVESLSDCAVFGVTGKIVQFVGIGRQVVQFPHVVVVQDHFVVVPAEQPPFILLSNVSFVR